MQAGYVYIVHAVGTCYIKVGKTTHVSRRIQQLGSGMPFPVRLLYAELVKDMDTMEQVLKSRYAGFHARGEWFELSQEVLEQWPAVSVSPAVPALGQGQRMPRIIPIRAVATLEERMLALLKKEQSFTVRSIQRHLFGASAKDIKTIFTQLENSGTVTCARRGRTVVFSLTGVA